MHEFRQTNFGGVLAGKKCCMRGRTLQSVLDLFSAFAGYFTHQLEESPFPFRVDAPVHRR
jgi:hypothetical protein